MNWPISHRQMNWPISHRPIMTLLLHLNVRASPAPRPPPPHTTHGSTATAGSVTWRSSVNDFTIEET